MLQNTNSLKNIALHSKFRGASWQYNNLKKTDDKQMNTSAPRSTFCVQVSWKFSFGNTLEFGYMVVGYARHVV